MKADSPRGGEFSRLKARTEPIAKRWGLKLAWRKLEADYEAGYSVDAPLWSLYAALCVLEIYYPRKGA